MESCVICGATTGDVVLRPRTPKEDVRSMLAKWASKGEFVEAHRRSSRGDDWSWHRQCMAKIQPHKFARQYGDEEQDFPVEAHPEPSR